MNQQHYSPVSSEPLVKRRRGRPRKEDVLSHLSNLPPIKPPASMGTQVFIQNQTNESQSSIPPFQPQADLSKGKAPAEDTAANGCGIKDDEMIGKPVTAVLDGKFDAGYLLTVVKVGENDASMKGLVFQPGKFVPVTKDNDIAPDVKMYSRVGQGCGDSVMAVTTVDSVPFTLDSTSEKIEEVKVVEFKADKELDPIALFPEKTVPEVSSGVVPDKVFTEEEQNVVVSEKNNEGLEHFGSPSLELSLSNTSFGDTQVQTDVSKPAVENLEVCLDSSLVKDVMKISMDVDTMESTHDGSNNKVAELPVKVPFVGLDEEIEPGEEVSMLDRAAKKQKVDDSVKFSEVVSLELAIQSEGSVAPKEPVENQGFINSLACLNKPMETD